jgi:hypothetical protein
LGEKVDEVLMSRRSKAKNESGKISEEVAGSADEVEISGGEQAGLATEV